MPAWMQLALAAIGGGAMTAVANIFVQILRTRGEQHVADGSISAKLQEHWTETTMALVGALRTELQAAKEELAGLRPQFAEAMSRVAHLEEALDHLHALAAAVEHGIDVEVSAAVRRARAFLRRMRGEQARGEKRQDVQVQISAQRVVSDDHSED